IPYRVALSRKADDGTMKLRVAFEPADHPAAEFDGALQIGSGAPHAEGALTISRAVGLTHDRGQAVAREPWRITSHVTADAATAGLEQIEFQYGPEERAARLKGDAQVAFGAHPHVDGVFTAQQLDIDRILALPDEVRRKPFAVLKSLVTALDGGHLAMPV